MVLTSWLHLDIIRGKRYCKKVFGWQLLISSDQMPCWLWRFLKRFDDPKRLTFRRNVWFLGLDNNCWGPEYKLAFPLNFWLLKCLPIENTFIFKLRCFSNFARQDPGNVPRVGAVWAAHRMYWHTFVLIYAMPNLGLWEHFYIVKICFFCHNFFWFKFQGQDFNHIFTETSYIGKRNNCFWKIYIFTKI